MTQATIAPRSNGRRQFRLPLLGVSTIKNINAIATPAKIDSKLLASARAIVTSMTRGDAAVMTAKEQAEARTGLSTKQAVLKMLGGINEQVTETVWRKTYQPAVTAALTEAYPDGYGPRLSHIKVMTLGISAGIDGPAGRRQYYEATLPLLVERGLLAKAKAGRPTGTTGGAVNPSSPAKGADTGKVEAAPVEKVTVPAFKPGKAYSQADMVQAAMILFGSPEFATKLVKVARNAELADALKNAVNILLD